MIAARTTLAPRAAVRCQATTPSKATALLSGAAAAALLVASPSFAGVQPIQPEKKPAVATEKKEKAEKKVEKKEESSEGGIDTRVLAFPLSLIGAAGVLAIPGVSDTVAKTVIRDSNELGAGFEVALKDGSIGTRVTSKKGTKKGGLFG